MHPPQPVTATVHQPMPRTHHAPCIKSQGTARAGLGGLHPTQGRVCEEAMPQAACLNPHPASRSSFLPWKAPGSHGKASPGLSGPACGWGSSKHCRCFVSSCLLLLPGPIWAEGLQSLIPPCPISDGDDSEQAVWGAAAAPWNKIELPKL